MKTKLKEHTIQEQVKELQEWAMNTLAEAETDLTELKEKFDKEFLYHVEWRLEERIALERKIIVLNEIIDYCDSEMPSDELFVFLHRHLVEIPIQQKVKMRVASKSTSVMANIIGEFKIEGDLLFADTLSGIYKDMGIEVEYDLDPMRCLLY